MTAGVLAALLVLVALWGSAFPMIKVGLAGLSAPHLTLARHLVASAAFVPFLLLRRNRMLPRGRDVPWFLLLGALGFTIYHLALNLGELRVSAGAASLIIATAPAITALLARFMAHERMPPAAYLGSTVAFAGVFMVVLGDGATIGFNAYALLVLLSAVVTSFFAVLQRPMFARYAAVEVTAFATWSGTALMLPFLPGFTADVASAGGPALVATTYIGLFPSAIAYSMFAYALSKTAVTLVATYLYLVPVVSLALSWVVLGEVPSLLTVLGGGVVIGGIVLVNLAKQRASRRLLRA
jgi:drug/metabolite transporter (DMT)-like permease